MAMISGSFLSGAMTALSAMAVPVLLDTTTHPPQLFHQWVRMFHYGHLILPTLSVATSLLYGYIAASRKACKKPWRTAALAGIATVMMVPFTWVFMSPTNSLLFQLEAASRTMPDVATVEEARRLVVKWSWMHLARSVFPLAGAALNVGY
ncbi:hypothetical protein ARAM_005672 [Aspergillus rambellii]|uniref:DUF1772-domain-containing protein n=1 Tax=Aspergillus rambellii TaxID=308745 RepID=A0A0F8V5L6_9EURO|nr:hypothetical protein ARAM_005672 [Aspergillus rambellii]